MSYARIGMERDVKKMFIDEIMLCPRLEKLLGIFLVMKE